MIMTDSGRRRFLATVAIVLALGGCVGCGEDSPLAPASPPPDMALRLLSAIEARLGRFALAGDHAFVAFPGAIVVFALASGPVAPEVARLDLPAPRARCLLIEGNRLYVGSTGTPSIEEGSLRILDIADPLAPRLLGGCGVDPWVDDIAVQEAVAYLAAGSNLVAVDVADAVHPAVVATRQSNYGLDLLAATATRLFAHEIRVVSGPWVYDCDWGFSIWSLNVAGGPLRAAFVDSVPGVANIEVVGDTAVFNEYGTLRFWDTAATTDPRQGESVSVWPDFITDFACADGAVYLACGQGGLVTVAMPGGGAPSVVGGYATTGGASRVAVAGDRIGLQTGFGDLEILDAANPAAPVLRARIPTPPANGQDLVLVGGLAFAAGGLVPVGGCAAAGRLAIVDISAPSAPRVLGVHDAAGLATGVAVAGDRAYVTHRECQASPVIVILDIRNPAAPAELGRVTLPRVAARIAIEGDLLYAGGDEFAILDASDPGSTAEIGSTGTPHPVEAVAAQAARAYAVGGERGFLVIDVADPRAPAIVGSASTADAPHDIVVSGNLAFVAVGGNEWRGLEIFDVSDPVAPRLAGRCELPGSPVVRVSLDGDHALVTTSVWGVIVVDVSDPARPYLAGETPIMGMAAVGDGLVCQLTSDAFRVLSLEPIGSADRR